MTSQEELCYTYASVIPMSVFIKVIKDAFKRMGKGIQYHRSPEWNEIYTGLYVYPLLLFHVCRSVLVILKQLCYQRCTVHQFRVK